MTKIKWLFTILIIFIVSCASTPDETVEEPTTDQVDQTVVEPTEVVTESTETIEVEPEPIVIEEEPIIIEEPIVIEPVIEDIPEPLDETLLKDAKKDIFKAQEAKAQTYFPSRLNDLKNKLAEANALKDSDPDKARLLLAEISVEAKKLTQDSLDALKHACIEVIDYKTTSLLKLKADKYTPEEFMLTQEQAKQAKDAFDANLFTESLALYRISYTSLTNLYNSLSKNLGYLENLLRLINNYKTEGEAISAEMWAPNEYKLAVESYKKSSKLFYQDYDAIAGEASLRETHFLARKAVEQAKINIEVAKTDQEILELMAELESASSLTILDADDNIISPEEWEGTADFIESPIEAEVEKDEESGLEPVDLDKDVKVEYPEISQAIIKIIPNTTKVLGVFDARKSMLAEAKEFWALGIEARNNGDLIAAKQYLAKSKVYLEEYKSMAVDYIYTVILNPELRDCLWRISEKDDFYGDPFLWQNIWERNKKLIQDPDLIYPGWKLIIPPLD
ncbi:MAG: LysM peptidoglycan-binding domain-containing protein [Spirochaetaceae bacterium]